MGVHNPLFSCIIGYKQLTPFIMIAQTSFNLSDIKETYNGWADWGEANLKEMQELIEEINELSWFADGGNTNPHLSFIISM